MQQFDMSPAEAEKLHVEIAKLMAETRTSALTREIFWYPLAVATGLIVATATVTTLVIKFV